MVTESVMSPQAVLFGSLTVQPSFCDEKFFCDYYLAALGVISVPENIWHI